MLLCRGSGLEISNELSKDINPLPEPLEGLLFVNAPGVFFLCRQERVGLGLL